MSSLFSSKFVRIVKTLSPEEWKSFELWLKSPWANSNKNLIRLLDKLKKYYPDFTDTKLSKEKLFKQILPDGKFSLRRMNNLLSEGYLAAERFLVFQNLSHNQNLQKNLLTKELQGRSLDEWFFRDIEEEVERLEELPVKEWEDHLQLYQLHRRIYHHPSQSRRMQPGELTIVKMDEELDLLYLLEKAAIITEKTFRNRIIKNENHDIDRDLRLWQVESENINHPAIKLYKMRFAYQEDSMVEQFLHLRKVFIESFIKTNKKEQKMHLLWLLNDAFYLIKRKKIDLAEFFPLYELGVSNDLLLQHGMMTRVTYTTSIIVSNSLNKFEFTSLIIEKYSKFLLKEIQADAISWAKAHTASKKKQYDLALQLLLSHDFASLYFKKVTRVLTLQTYFELFLNSSSSYYLYLLSFCDSFEKWVQREKLLSQGNKEAYLHFIQKCRSLAKIYLDVDFNEQKLLDVLSGESNIEAFKWLTEKQEQIRVLKS